VAATAKTVNEKPRRISSPVFLRSSRSAIITQAGHLDLPPFIREPVRWTRPYCRPLDIRLHARDFNMSTHTTLLSASWASVYGYRQRLWPRFRPQTSLSRATHYESYLSATRLILVVMLVLAIHSGCRPASPPPLAEMPEPNEVAPLDATTQQTPRPQATEELPLITRRSQYEYITKSLKDPKYTESLVAANYSTLSDSDHKDFLMRVVECAAENDYRSARLQFYFEAKERTFGHRFRWNVLLQHNGQGFYINDILFDAVVGGVSGDYGHAPIAERNKPVWHELEQIVATCNKRALAEPAENLPRRIWTAIGEQLETDPLPVSALKPLLEEYLATGATDHQSEAKSLLSQCSLATNTKAMADYWRSRNENDLTAFSKASPSCADAKLRLEREWDNKLTEMFPDPRFRSVYLEALFNELDHTIEAIALRPQARDDEGVLRVTLGGSVTGEYTIRLAIQPRAEEKAAATRRTDGAWACTHLFTSHTDASIFNNSFGTAGSASVDEGRKCLVFKASEPPVATQLSEVVYPHRFPLPFEVTVDLCLASSSFCFHLYPTTQRLGDQPVSFFFASNNGLNGPFRVIALAKNNSPLEAPVDPLLDKTIVLSSPWETKLFIPGQVNASQGKRLLRIGVTGASSVGVGMIRLRAILSPTLGLALEQREGRVFVKDVVPDSFAWAAGAKRGDVVETVRGQPVENVSEALDLLGDIPFEESSEIGMRRDSESVSLSITPRIMSESH